jgi:nucleoside 2-deoxyribosyltransferase
MTAEERAARSPRPRIYVAGPISSDPLGNVRRGVEVWHELWERGFNPYLPHLTCYLELAQHREYEEWMELDFSWLLLCDAVLRLPGVSPGADRETGLAISVGIPVYHSVLTLTTAYNTKVSA